MMEVRQFGLKIQESSSFTGSSCLTVTGFLSTTSCPSLQYVEILLVIFVSIFLSRKAVMG